MPATKEREPRKHVLIVEPDGAARRVIARVLRALGFRVTSVARPGAGAAAAAMPEGSSRAAVDLLVLNYVPPGGEPAADSLLARARAAGVPYVFTTDRPELLERLDVPPALYLRKPVSVKNLVRMALDYLVVPEQFGFWPAMQVQ